MAVSGTLKNVVTLSTTNALDLSTPTDALSYTLSKAITSGTGANQANRVFHDQRSLVATSETLDLQTFGGAVDGVGQTFNLTRVVCLYIENTSTTDALIVGNAASNRFEPPFSAAGTITIRPGGALCIISPDATGYAVSGTVKSLKIDSGAASITYKIIVVGSQ